MKRTIDRTLQVCRHIVTVNLAESDEQLLARYRDSGDVQAFEELVHRYEAPIYNYLVRYLRNAVLAEEVFQSTFFRVHDRCRQFTEGRQFRPWLYSIATHQAIDMLRREGKHPTVSLDQVYTNDAGPDAGTLLNMLESSEATPLEQIETAERREWTQQAVDNLPEILRVVVLLIYFQGLKYREAAEALELPVGTVKSRAHRALAELNLAWKRDHAQDKGDADAR